MWHLADPKRAYVAERLQADTEARMHLLLVAGPGSASVELQAEVNALDRLGRELEEPAEAAEMTIWKELVGGHRER